MSGRSSFADHFELFKGRSKYLRKAIKAALQRSRRQCCLCGFEGSFVHAGTPAVMDAGCPRCRSKPRHRLLMRALENHPEIPRGGKVLHFASERSLKPFIDKLAPREYVRADIDARRGDIVLNIEHLDLPSESFDCIVCSHVLEHVDDRKAMPELHRVLRDGGLLIAMVPLIEGWDSTYEDPGMTSRDQRKEHFGGQTHVRYYGSDFRERLAAAGFKIDEFTGTPEDVSRYALIRGERVFLAWKK